MTYSCNVLLPVYSLCYCVYQALDVWHYCFVWVNIKKFFFVSKAFE